MDEVVELLQQLIRNQCVNDGSDTSGEERRNVDVLRTVIEGAGLDVEEHEPLPGRASLVARIEGSDPNAPSMCWLAHTDVVPVNERGWREDPFGGEVIDGEVWGRGAIDMLNMAASMTTATRRLADSGWRPKGDLVLALVADEEAGGHHGAEWLAVNVPDAVRTDYVITESGGFPLGEDDVKLPVLTSERGTLWSRLIVKGTPSHGSMPFRTDNALVKAGKVVQRIAEHRPPPVIDDGWLAFVDGFGLPPELTGPLKQVDGFNELCEILPVGLSRLAWSLTHTTIAPTMMSAGSKLNIIPDTVEIQLDVRTLPGHGVAEVWALLEDALGPDLVADVDFLPGLEVPASSSPRDTPLWDAMERVAQGFYAGSSLVPMLMTGATDSRHFRRHLDSVCYGFGLFSRKLSLEQLAAMGHGDDERIDIDSLTMMTDMWEVLARDVCG